MTREVLLGMLADLADAFPRQPVRPGTLTVYAAALADIPEEGLRDAIMRHVATSTFFPSIAELRTAYAEAASPVTGWEEAWSEVNRAIRLYGQYGIPQGAPEFGYKLPEWSSEPLARTVAAMDYRSLCESTNETADRAQFRQMFQAFRARHVEQIQVAPLLNGSGNVPSLAEVMGAR